MILSFSGHRQIDGFYYPNKRWNAICAEVVRILDNLKPDLILSGGALGFDSIACDAAISLGIKYNIAVPFLGQETAWPLESQKRYKRYLTLASEVIIVSEGGYTPEKMQIRNQYLVDNADMILACYDDSRKSGTGNCLSYSKLKYKEIIIIDPRKFK